MVIRFKTFSPACCGRCSFQVLSVPRSRIMGRQATLSIARKNRAESLLISPKKPSATFIILDHETSFQLKALIFPSGSASPLLLYDQESPRLAFVIRGMFNVGENWEITAHDPLLPLCSGVSILEQIIGKCHRSINPR